jgi:hypothetical protein
MFLDQGSELVRLAFLLTGDISVGGDAIEAALDRYDPTVPFFERWRPARCRKLVIARALANVQLPLAASICRVTLSAQNSTFRDQLPPPGWSAGRVAGYLSALFAAADVFENISIEDAVLLPRYAA